VKPPTPGDKAAEDYGEETTDDPDDDYGTDDTVFDPNPNAGFNQIITATWAAWGGSSAQVSTRSHRSVLAEHNAQLGIGPWCCVVATVVQVCYATTGKELRKFAEGNAR
jgi:hypothetical protein